MKRKILFNSIVVSLVLVLGVSGIGTTVVSAQTQVNTTKSGNISATGGSLLHEDFDSTTLDPAWQVQAFSGYGRYSLTDQPGYLRYYLEGSAGYSGGWRQSYQNSNGWSPTTTLTRSFSGDNWALNGKATYNLHNRMGSSSTGGQISNFYLAFGDGNDHYVHIERGVDYWYRSNWLTIRFNNIGGVPETQAENTDYRAQEDVDVNEWMNYTYFYRLERNGQDVSVSLSYDGFTYNLVRSFTLPASVSDMQRIIIDQTIWMNAGSYADWDYFTVEEIASTASLVANMDSEGEIYPGDSVSVDLTFQDTNNLYAAQATCTVDPTILEPQSGTFGDFFDPVNRLIGGNNIDASDGTWTGAISQRSPAGPLFGNGRFATITYQAKNPGTTSITCDVLLSDRDGFTQPVSFIGTSVTVLPFGAVAGVATYQGRVEHAGIALTATGPVTRTVTTDSAGNFVIGQLKPGSYTVTAQADGYLTNSITVNVASGETVTLPSTTLKGGSVNGDNVIDIGDATLVAANFGLTVPPGDARADINNDGAVNVQDLAILGSNYGLSSDQTTW